MVWTCLSWADGVTMLPRFGRQMLAWQNFYWCNLMHKFPQPLLLVPMFKLLPFVFYAKVQFSCQKSLWRGLIHEIRIVTNCPLYIVPLSVGTALSVKRFLTAEVFYVWATPQLTSFYFLGFKDCRPPQLQRSVWDWCAQPCLAASLQRRLLTLT